MNTGNEASQRKAGMCMRKLARLKVLGFVISLSLTLATCGYALEIERVSVHSSGNQGNGASFHPSISAEGLLVMKKFPILKAIISGSGRARRRL
jgi:hypothetical protein